MSSKDGFISHLTYLVQLPYLGKSQNTTRSQAVARIADRTAKNCRSHLT